MSTPKIQLAPTPARAPRLPIRIAWWLGIYLVGGAIFSHEMVESSGPHAWEHFGGDLVFFPATLSIFFPGSLGPSMNPTWFPFFVGFGIYLLHLIATLRVSRRIIFFIMLALLVVLIGLTFLGGEMIQSMVDS